MLSIFTTSIHMQFATAFCYKWSFTDKVACEYSRLSFAPAMRGGCIGRLQTKKLKRRDKNISQDAGTRPSKHPETRTEAATRNL